MSFRVNTTMHVVLSNDKLLTLRTANDRHRVDIVRNHNEDDIEIKLEGLDVQERIINALREVGVPVYDYAVLYDLIKCNAHPVIRNSMP